MSTPRRFEPGAPAPSSVVAGHLVSADRRSAPAGHPEAGRSRLRSIVGGRLLARCHRPSSSIVTVSTNGGRAVWDVQRADRRISRVLEAATSVRLWWRDLAPPQARRRTPSDSKLPRPRGVCIPTTRQSDCEQEAGRNDEADEYRPRKFSCGHLSPRLTRSPYGDPVGRDRAERQHPDPLRVPGMGARGERGRVAARWPNRSIAPPVIPTRHLQSRVRAYQPVSHLVSITNGTDRLDLLDGAVVVVSDERIRIRLLQLRHAKDRRRRRRSFADQNPAR